jgi:hypothetical protein
VVGALFVLIGSGLVFWSGPAPHHVTRDMAVKIALTHLVQPGETVQTQAKLARQWQLTMLNRNEGGNLWSNQLTWFVLVPGDHFAFSGPCCGPASPKPTWNVALVNDHAWGAQLDGVVAGSNGDAPGWFRLLPDLSLGGQ